jgi:Glycerol uptake facilitator and related permeases (Major Intrinsic Protein Family)
MSNALSRELLAEFFGTFILIVFGVGVVAQVVLSKGGAGSTLSINIAWGLAVTMGCYVAAGVTGAHLNPAVTLALAVHRRFPWNKVLPYSLAQLAGAFIASAVVFATYREALYASTTASVRSSARRERRVSGRPIPSRS